VKKTILSALLCLNLFCATAQDIPCTIQKSEVFKDKYKNSSLISLDEDTNGGVIVARSFMGSVFNSDSWGYYFEHYDANMKLINEYEHSVRGFVIGTIVKDGIVTMVDFGYDKETKEFICNANTANLNDFKFAKTELFRAPKTAVHTGLVFSGGGSADGDNFASMLVNSDKTAFAISLDIDDKEEKKEIHKIYVYDLNLKLKIDHTFKRDIKDRKFIYENIDISQDGNTVYLLGRAKTEDNKKKKEGGRYQYELTRITGSATNTQVFDTNEHFAASLTLLFKKDRIACVGLYSDRNDIRFKGLCYFDMDPESLVIKTSKFNPFTDQFMIDKYGTERDKELRDLEFMDVFLNKNNEIVFNAEERYTTTTQSFGPNGSMGGLYTRYHYDDIVSAKIADNGDLVWARNINKRQSTGGEESFVSYTSMVKDDYTYFFVNTADNVSKIYNSRIRFEQKSPKRSNLNVIRINKDGEFDYKELLDDKDNEVPFMVSEGAVATNSNSIYFMGRRGKKKQLLKLTL
jgi:hypothetical protein